MLNRRRILALLPAAFIGSTITRSLLAAQEMEGWHSIDGSPGAALQELQRKAGTVVGGGEKSLALPGAGEAYDVAQQRLVDMIDALQEGSQKSALPQERQQIDQLTDQAAELLGALTAKERLPFFPDLGQEKAARVYAYDDLRDGYLQLFDACQTSPERASTVNWYIGVLTKPKNKAQYEAVGERMKMPWYFVGIIHSLECGFNFAAHLHNGDPLRRKTFHVPAGRPTPWNPPSDWVSSAVDALTWEKFDKETDWSLAHMLYRFELYNGFGYRGRGVNTPYLWSFSSNYAKGKYVGDGHFDPNAVSLQCGAAVLVKELAARSVITLPQRT